jgi:hypothetical protein
VSPRRGSSGRGLIIVMLVTALAACIGAYVIASSTAGDDIAIAPERPLLVRAVDERVPRSDGLLRTISPDGVTRAIGLRCKRVHVSPAGIGLCLQTADNGLDYQGVVFGPDFRPLRRFRVPGVPDRARVAPDGRHAAYTSFDANGEQGYFETNGPFSTYTRIVDTRTGKVVLRLEDLRLSRAGKPFEPARRELWGVTFARDGRYYATVAAGGGHYLIEGRLGSSRARVLRERTECPSLSPDGTRIAYKRRIGDTNRWRLHVLDLRSDRDWPLAESRSIDDQPEWLDDDTIVYSDDRAVFAVPADGGGVPRRLAAAATSPSASGTQSTASGSTWALLPNP